MNVSAVLMIAMSLGMAGATAAPAAGSARPAGVSHTVARPPVSGRVTDAAGQPLEGVSVFVKGTQRGTATNEDGRFQLEAAKGDVLVFRIVGYKEFSVMVGDQGIPAVVLERSLSDLDEVVVVGYGTSSKRRLTTAIAKVSGADLGRQPVANPGDALAGLAAGVQVQSASGSQPGEAPTIRIRGIGSMGAANDPLYVVDGYPLPNAAQFQRINVSDIESIELLKDAASAAIYGSRAANGVVIVTTKRGKAGKTSFNVSAYTGVQSVYRKMDVMNKSEYLQYAKDATNAMNGRYPDIFDTPELLADTDWQDVIFRSAPMSDIQVSARGGSEKVRFSVSGNYTTQKGVMIGTDYKMGTVNANLDADLSAKLKIGASFAPSFTTRNLKPGPGTGGPASYVPVYAAMLMPPVVPVHLPNGDYGQNNVLPFTQYGFSEPGIHNPLAVLELYENKQNYSGLLSNVFLQWEPLKGLQIRSQGGVTAGATTYSEYTPSTLAYASAPFANLSNPLLTGLASQVTSNRVAGWLWENTVNYSRSLKGGHNLAGMLLYSMQRYSGTSTATRGRAGSFVNDQVHNPAAATDQIGTLGYELNSFLSYAARINYDYKNKYLLSASIRTDASSRFGPDNRFGVFQSYSAGWRISEEAFMQRQRIFDELKIRASYGETGNANIGDFTWMSGIGYANYSLGDQRVPGVYQSGYMNKELTWEKNRQLGIGLEAAFLKERIYLTVDLYNKETDGMLFSKELPGVIGYATSFQTNIGKLRNRGFEIELNTRNMQGAFKWNTNFNIAYNRSEVMDLGGRTSLNTFAGTGGWPNVYRVEVGKPLGSFYGFIIDGVFKNAEELQKSPKWPGSGVGDYKIRDVNGDGEINEGDRTLLGNGFPDYVYGITNNFSYKNFDLSILFQGTLGNGIINGAARHSQLWIGKFNAVKDMANNYFRPEEPDRDVKYARVGPRAGFATASHLSSYAVYSGSFLRLRNITLGYNLPDAFARRMMLQSARLYVTAQNLFTLTEYPGFNPEPSQYGASVYQPGTDQGGYPLAKSIMVGINIGF
ncbi:SusC/RagA family TonB-linked outer membrane protein [Chitinophaga alhagiae]|uniref:SusC/RagA family TonB-linked outer membrane protein n=2 Tax=Chitinophaga alhagiae TaxID=2203219 RepID=A0ABM6WAU7_9BACT|nr:SusC/RagA family TonB-linked outer membrane protein [Chitinophaga alhagiae]